MPTVIAEGESENHDQLIGFSNASFAWSKEDEEDFFLNSTTTSSDVLVAVETEHAADSESSSAGKCRLFRCWCQVFQKDELTLPKFGAL